jgi:TPR repeat protein
LSYFGRDGQVSEADKLVLTTSYSSEVEPGMSPLPALAIVARRLVDAYPPGAAKAEAARAAQTFLRTTVAQMENFATGGEPPGSVLRSGKTTAAGLAQGRIETQFLLGAAYMEGQIVDADPNRGVGWLTKAAYAAHADAQLSLADAYARGSGVAADPVESYKWCYLAASQGGTRARSALQLMETRLRPDQVAAGKARAAAWQQSKS